MCLKSLWEVVKHTIGKENIYSVFFWDRRKMILDFLRGTRHSCQKYSRHFICWLREENSKNLILSSWMFWGKSSQISSFQSVVYFLPSQILSANKEFVYPPRHLIHSIISALRFISSHDFYFNHLFSEQMYYVIFFVILWTLAISRRYSLVHSVELFAVQLAGLLKEAPHHQLRMSLECLCLLGTNSLVSKV